jgi:hypothetical protein
MKAAASIKKSLQLMLGLVIIWLVVTQFHRLIPGETGRQIFDRNQAQNRDAGALFYTESEEAMEIEYRMKKDGVRH